MERTRLPSLLRFPLRLDGTGQHRLPPSHRFCSAATLTMRTRGQHMAASDVLSKRRCKRRVVHHVIARSARDLIACGSRKSGGIWSNDNFSAKPVLRKTSAQQTNRYRHRLSPCFLLLLRQRRR